MIETENQKRDYLSLLDLSPYRSFNSERLHLVLAGYLDYSQDEKGTEYMTLACIVSSEAIWPGFEQAWSTILARAPHTLNSFHMAPAMSTRKPKPFQDWTETEVEDLVSHLLETINEFAHVTAGMQFIIKSCTIKLKDYRKVKIENPHLRTPEAICVNFCCGTALPPDRANPGAEYQQVLFYFDRTEKFLRTIRSNWLRGKKYHRRRSQPSSGWPKQIKDILAVNAEDVPALQAVDVIAWITNGFYKGDSRAQRLFDVISQGRMKEFYDYEKIKQEYGSDKPGTDPYS